MGSPDKKFDIVDVVRSWIPRRPESSNVSRDFWMPDQSCRVCYECDSQFTVFNRRHHCRLCGRVFCGKCASHSIPVPLDESRSDREECERIRVCSYCFKQWEQGLVTISHEDRPSCLGLSPSPSASSLGSLASSFSGISGNSTANSMAYSTGPYEHVLYNSCASPQPGNGESDRSTITGKADVDNPHSTSEPYDLSVMRSDDEDNEHSEYQSDLETRQFSQSDEYYGTVSFDDVYGSFNRDLSEEDNDRKAPGSLSPESFSTEDVKEIKTTGEELGRHISNEDSEASLYGIGNLDVGNFDFENNRLLWLPPEPEHEEDEREVDMFDDDDADNANGEWGYSRSSSGLSRGDLGNREKSNEEHRRAMRDVVSGHFRALIAQLLQVENLPVSEAYDQDSWLDIITSLSWETASLLKPDMSKGSGMDPGGYVKVKCLSCGHRRESAVIKGVVCKKNVAHRRMASKLDKPRLLILGGALEYQRVTNHLSSFNTLLKQEMDHLKMAVAKIGAHHPNILLVEKSVSRFAQEYLLAKNISLVLNIKRPLLERIARCTGAQIVPSIDHLVSPKLGFCGFFHVERYYEEHGSAGQGGKKQTKTLMFFEDCPKPLGCTILLKGAPGDELKKVKHVVHYGVFAAYHLALETSFLADEGASLPELPLKSPITVALPDKPSSINRSISTVPDFTAPTKETPPSNQNNCLISHTSLPVLGSPVPKSEQAQSSSQTQYVEPASNLIEPVSLGSLSPSAHLSSDPYHNDAPQWNSSECIGNKGDQFPESDHSTGRAVSKTFGTLGSLKENAQKRNTDESTTCENDPGSLAQTTNDHNEKMQFSNDGFPPSSSDQQSILVSLTTRCLWKQVVCERAHLCRIKYYGSFDKPLGRFLQDHLFDQNYRCRSCDMPSEAHIYCYTHLQGSLTISVTKLHDNLLPGEREGKIWMWHRCLRCPRTMGDPPATRRVVMSDAAWGLSFGKFLELSFSNHAAASRVASCGHLLHRDCLRFYGCGRMVACFRYAPIKVYSVYLPRPKLEFNYDEQEWVQKEANEVSDGAKLLFTEVCSALNLILENVSHAGSSDGSMIAYELRKRIAQRERMLKKEKEEFEATLEKALNREATSGQPTIDILEINRLRRQLLLRSYIWDLRLRRAASLCSDILKSMEKPHDPSENTEKNAIPKAKISDEMPRTLLDEEADVERVNKTNSFNEERNLDEKSSNEKEGESVPRRKDADESDSLQSGNTVRKVLSDRQFPARTNISDTLDAVWTGESYSGNISPNENDSVLPVNGSIDASKFVKSASASSNLDKFSNSQSDVDIENSENPKIWFEMPFLNIYDSLNKHSSWNEQKLVGIAEYNPVYVLSFNEFKRQGGTRLLLPVGINDTVVPVYDDEPTSIISYVLLSQDYHHQMSNDPETRKNNTESSVSFPLSDSASLLSLISSGEIISGSLRTLASSEESSLSMSGPKNSQVLDPVFYNKSLHTRVSFAENGPLGKVKYSVTCYYAKRFEALRKICCPSELDFIRSLSRCKKWGAQGGKSNVFFAKTLDDRFIIKQVTKTELESFLKFAPAYFTYLSESISSGSPTCLAKILGMYQFTTKHVKGGKESKMDVLVMENLLFRRNVTRLYDLKGSSRSRYNPDSSGGNKVLLDQNLLETMPTSPIFLRNKAKRLLERAVWNDTSFLASIDVMDYSLLVGLDEERQELVLGIIDFMRQYTWDKHLETWVKASGILGGPKNASPTVISPEQYKKRFRKAMSSYFLMVPDQWSPPIIVLEGKSSSDLRDDKIRKSWPLTIDVSGLVLNPGCEVAKMGC